MYVGRKLGCKQSLSFEEICFNWYPLAAVPPVIFASFFLIGLRSLKVCRGKFCAMVVLSWLLWISSHTRRYLAPLAWLVNTSLAKMVWPKIYIEFTNPWQGQKNILLSPGSTNTLRWPSFYLEHFSYQELLGTTCLQHIYGQVGLFLGISKSRFSKFPPFHANPASVQTNSNKKKVREIGKNRLDREPVSEQSWKEDALF